MRFFFLFYVDESDFVVQLGLGSISAEIGSMIDWEVNRRIHFQSLFDPSQGLYLIKHWKPLSMICTGYKFDEFALLWFQDSVAILPQKFIAKSVIHSEPCYFLAYDFVKFCEIHLRFSEIRKKKQKNNIIKVVHHFIIFFSIFNLKVCMTFESELEERKWFFIEFKFKHIKREVEFSLICKLYDHLVSKLSFRWWMHSLNLISHLIHYTRETV